MLALALQMWLWLGVPAETSDLADAGAHAGLLTFETQTTPGSDPQEALPTVVVLHGRDEALHGLPRALRATKEPLRVVLPKGPRVQRDGRHAWFRRSEARVCRSRSDEVTAVADQVSELLSSLIASGLVRGRPILVGYSQGAVVALEVSLRSPEVVGEVVAIGGYLPPSHVPQELVEHAATHVLFGAQDRVMSSKVSRRQVEHLRSLGFLIDADPFPGQGHGLSPKMRRAAVQRVRAGLRAQAAE